MESVCVDSVCEVNNNCDGPRWWLDGPQRPAINCDRSSGREHVWIAARSMRLESHTPARKWKRGRSGCRGQLWNGKLAGTFAIISAAMSWSKPAHRTTEMGVQVAYVHPKKNIMQRAGFNVHQRGQPAEETCGSAELKEAAIGLRCHRGYLTIADSVLACDGCSVPTDW